MASSQEHLQSLDYARPSSIPTGLSFGEQVGLVAAILPLILLLLFHGVVAVSPWTLGELCSAADDGIPISPAASKLTDIGVLLHFVACIISPLFGMGGFVLLLWALIQRSARSQIVAGIMTACGAAAAVIGISYAMELAGF